jgi:hypothetical protein
MMQMHKKRKRNQRETKCWCHKCCGEDTTYYNAKVLLDPKVVAEPRATVWQLLLDGVPINKYVFLLTIVKIVVLLTWCVCIVNNRLFC